MEYLYAGKLLIDIEITTENYKGGALPFNQCTFSRKIMANSFID